MGEEILIRLISEIAGAERQIQQLTTRAKEAKAARAEAEAALIEPTGIRARIAGLVPERVRVGAAEAGAAAQRTLGALGLPAVPTSRAQFKRIGKSVFVAAVGEITREAIFPILELAIPKLIANSGVILALDAAQLVNKEKIEKDLEVRISEIRRAVDNFGQILESGITGLKMTRELVGAAALAGVEGDLDEAVLGDLAMRFASVNFLLESTRRIRAADSKKEMLKNVSALMLKSVTERMGI